MTNISMFSIRAHVPCFSKALPGLNRPQPSRLLCRDGTPGSDGQRPSAMSEDLIARLKAAEEEAQVLKKQLAAAQAQAGTPAAAAEEQPRPAATSRIDGGDLRRETLAFVESKPRNWLSESDVEFFTGGGPSEAEGTSPVEEDADGVVRRRLLIGLGLSVAAGAFALVPTERLQSAPSKPLFFYLVPLIRVAELLKEVERVIPEGNYEALRQVLSLIEGSPNNVQSNLRAAAALLPDPAAGQAAEVARDCYEYVKNIDYQTYYDSVGGQMGTRGGSKQQELFDFSLKSAAAARSKLRDFLALMPRDQLDAATQQIASSPF